MSDGKYDRDVNIEQLALEITALRGAAMRYTRAVDQEHGAEGAGLDLEAAALHYVRKLDDVTFEANKTDYNRIVEEALRNVPSV